MANFPSHLIPNNEKNDNWIKKFIKAAWDDYGASYPDSFFNARDKYHETKLYMLGQQSVSKYKNLVDSQNVANKENSYFNLDFSVLPIVPKFRRIAIGKLQKSKYNVGAEAIDPHAINEKNKYFADLQARMMLKEELKVQGMGQDLVSLAKDEPQDENELDIFRDYGYKHAMASEMEMAITMVLEENKYDNLRKRIIENIFDFGVGGYREYIDPSTGRIKIREVNPMQYGCSFTSKEDFSDTQYEFEIKEMSLADLKVEAGTQITKEQYEQIYAKLGNRTQLRGNIHTDRHPLDSKKVKVMDIEFYSYNDYTVEERVNSKGNTVYGRTSKKRKSNKYHKKSYKVVYKGKWVVETDAFYSLGLLKDMKRNKSNMSETSNTFHMIAPEIYQGITYSIGEQMKPIADQIQITWLKLQNVILRARPKGIQIEITSLENVPIGASGDAMKPLQIVDMYNKTGNLVYRAIDDVGQGTPARPIEELNNGLGDEAQRYFQHIQSLIQTLRDITGFNELSDGSTPDPRTLKSVAQSAVESTNNSLAYIGISERQLANNLFESLGTRVCSLAKRGKLQGYVQSIGRDSVDFIKVSSKVSLHTYGIFLRDVPDEEQRQTLNQRMNLALQSNQITVADTFIIDNTPNLKQAEAILAYRIELKRKKDMEQSAALQQQNSQAQVQASQAAEAAKQKTIQLEAQIKERQIMLQGQIDEKLLILKKSLEENNQKIAADSRVEQSRILGDSRERVEQARSEKDLEKERIRKAPELQEQMVQEPEEQGLEMEEMEEYTGESSLEEELM